MPVVSWATICESSTFDTYWCSSLSVDYYWWTGTCHLPPLIRPPSDEAMLPPYLWCFLGLFLSFCTCISYIYYIALIIGLPFLSWFSSMISVSDDTSDQGRVSDEGQTVEVFPVFGFLLSLLLLRYFCIRSPPSYADILLITLLFIIISQSHE